MQQTRVDQGLKYWEKFLNEFPTLKSLSESEESRVLALWSGLGYYSRARNIHKAAKIISNDLRGEFPKSSLKLIKIPGIGPYTAAAISSICFDEVIPAIDGNAFRVYTRLFAIDSPIEKKKTINKINELSLPLISRKRPGDSNQAIMDIGSSICYPKKPKCNYCPFEENCLSRKYGNQEKYPVKTKPAKLKEVNKFYVILNRKGYLGLVERPKNGIWGGLWMPLELDPENWDLAIKNNQIHKNNISYQKHLLSHRKMNLYFADWTTDKAPENKNIKWFSIEELKNMALPAPMIKFLREKSYI